VSALAVINVLESAANSNAHTVSQKTRLTSDSSRRQTDGIHTGDVAREHGAVVAHIRANALAVVCIPQVGRLVLCARHQQVALRIVFEEREWPARVEVASATRPVTQIQGSSRLLQTHRSWPFNRMGRI
jgi:hypothetical protein